ncbi:MAG: nucleotide exchange factor GrpE [Gemmataceae bacterium]|nr:nucleotide exchange factor GrpE [Gemmataceae bacterium]MCI0740333.1 nucleotide exchange factor GrpE [Gemmataceae bacterium]
METPNNTEPTTLAVDQEVETLRQQAAEYRDLAQRIRAEFENYQKRNARERELDRKYSSAPVLLDLLPVLDNLERALTAAQQAGSLTPNPTPPQERGESEALSQGVALVQTQFLDMLKRHGVTRIEAAGQSFDPNLHQAVMQQPSAQHDPGKVLQVLEQGYMYHDRVLRPAKVIVSAKPAN